MGRRILAVVPLLVGILTLVFLLVQMAPGDSFSLEPGAGTSPHAAEHLRRIFGADRPLPERYLAWMAAFFGGDLGVSFSFRRPVGELLKEAVGNSLVLAGLAVFLQFLLGVAVGVAAGASRSRRLDRAIAIGASLVYSLSSYWLALGLVWLFAVRLGWLPVSQMHSLDADSVSGWRRFLDTIRHLVLPCLSLTLPSAAGIALYVREEVRSSLTREFIRRVRARGLREREVVLRHGLSSAMLSVVNLLGLALPGIAGGSVVLEVLFAWPGMGRLAYQAVLSRDEPLILGCTWIASLLVVAGSLLADLLSAWADPRIRESLS